MTKDDMVGACMVPLSVFWGREMKVVKIEEFTKTKSKVVIEGIGPVVLYKKDLKRYQIAEGNSLEDRQVSVILKEILPCRAKARCLKLLQSKDYTEYEIRKKLTADGYQETVIDDAVKYLYGYHYLDDEKYVKLYYQSKNSKKSKKQIILDLQQKGIAKETILSVLQDMLGDKGDEDYPCIFRLLRKKHYTDCEATFEEKEKVKAFLFRKGFQINDINICMQNFSWENM